MTRSEDQPTVGRRPGANATRQAIIEAAGPRFEASGYAGTSMRAIARDSGVDPALITHFFGSKAGLFGAVVRWPLDPEEFFTRMLDGDRDSVGRRLAETFVYHWSTVQWRSPIIALVSAGTTDPAAGALLRDFLLDRLLVPMLDALEVDQPRMRAGLISAQLIGLGLGRHVFALVDSAEVDDQQLIDAVAPTLQRYCAEPLH